jgi:flagellar basal body-associated protein FliL
MADGLLTIADAGGPSRRVRTPGKYIVFAGAAVAALVGASTLALRAVDEDAAPAAAAAAILFAPSDVYFADLSPDEEGRIAYLRLKAKLVASDAEALEAIREKAPLVRERIAFFLRQLRPEDFEGSEGTARVKAELLKRANLVLPAGAARDIVIEEIVIQ